MSPSDLLSYLSMQLKSKQYQPDKVVERLTETYK